MSTRNSPQRRKKSLSSKVQNPFRKRSKSRNYANQPLQEQISIAEKMLEDISTEKKGVRILTEIMNRHHDRFAAEILALYYLNRGESKETIQIFEDGLMHHEPHALYLLGCVYHKGTHKLLPDHKRAIQCWMKAAKSHKWAKENLMKHYGHALRKMKDLKEKQMQKLEQIREKEKQSNLIEEAEE